MFACVFCCCLFYFIFFAVVFAAVAAVAAVVVVVVFRSLSTAKISYTANRLANNDDPGNNLQRQAVDISNSFEYQDFCN